MALDQSYQDDIVREGCGIMTDSCSKGWKSVTAAASDAEDDEPEAGFECNICFDTVQDPVVTLCGHLYCWPCIYRWLQVQETSPDADELPSQKQCPVCKAEVTQETLVPLYGRGGSTKSSKSKAHNLGVGVPRRPFGPACGVDSPRPLGMVSTLHSTRRVHDRSLPPQQTSTIFPNPQFQGYSSPTLVDPMVGMIGEMVLARVLGGIPTQMQNLYTYPNSYHLVGMSSPRVRRHVMETDKSLSRICFFLLCCIVLCLLLF
ncbi:hypothetical protein MLD38_030541 [Melastoma candidum]|uniref:Uncharacterized protein n=1 Tax=Melastoma candidum TaxID=119954 RepID=A0ACB9MLX3_9MYRT|nr:hypothetical protein MLD38_030541 [Melastoma candidum]